MSLALVIQLLAGAVGGNVVGGSIRRLDLGSFANTLAGCAGGVGGCALLAKWSPALGSAVVGEGMGIDALFSQIIGAGIGGSVLMTALGIVRLLVRVPAR